MTIQVNYHPPKLSSFTIEAFPLSVVFGQVAHCRIEGQIKISEQQNIFFSWRNKRPDEILFYFFIWYVVYVYKIPQESKLCLHSWEGPQVLP